MMMQLGAIRLINKRKPHPRDRAMSSLLLKTEPLWFLRVENYILSLTKHGKYYTNILNNFVRMITSQAPSPVPWPRAILQNSLLCRRTSPWQGLVEDVLTKLHQYVSIFSWLRRSLYYLIGVIHLAGKFRQHLIRFEVKPLRMEELEEHLSGLYCQHLAYQ